MIAPIRETEPKKRAADGSISTARQWVAATLCRSQAESTSIATWKAWIFVAWIVFVTYRFGMSMLGW